MLETGYTSPKVIAKRLKRSIKRGDKILGEVRQLTVEFDSDFDQFVARVAYGLRSRIVYRTDGGKFARGLVRANDSLKLIHDAYLATATPNGTPIHLHALLARRRDAKTENRWVMIIHFAAVDWMFEDEEPGDVISADSSIVPAASATWMDTLIDLSILRTADRGEFPGERGDRVRKILDIADRLGYPKNLDVWYYNRPAVIKYIEWRTPEAAKKKMSWKTNGKFPFEGDTGPTLHIEWRVFPFREITQECMAQTPEHCVAKFLNKLIWAESEMELTFREIDKEINRVAMASGMNPNGATQDSSGLGPLANAFLKHLNAQLGIKEQVYSVFK